MANMVVFGLVQQPFGSTGLLGKIGVMARERVLSKWYKGISIAPWVIIDDNDISQRVGSVCRRMRGIPWRASIGFFREKP